MTTVFCRVTAELSKDFVQLFPHQFDFQGLLQKISEDSGVAVSTSDSLVQNDSNRDYILQGLWPAIEQAHNMLLTLAYSSVGRCEQESQISPGSRPFSALVEAAEAMSRGAELQQQVENELAIIKNSTLNDSFSSASDIPVSLNTISTHDISYTTFNQEKSVMGIYSTPLNTHSDEKHNEHELHDISSMTTKDSKGDTISQPVESTHTDIIHEIIAESSKENEPDETTEATEIHVYLANNSTDDNLRNKETNDTFMSNSETEKSVPVKKRQKRTVTQQTEQSTSPKNRYNRKTKLMINQSDVKMPPEIENNLVKSDDNKSPARNDAGTQGKPETEESFACEFDYCRFVAKNRKAYTDHTQRIHFSEPSQCDICNKVFANERYMKRHQAIHCDAKYPCGKCDKVYKIYRALENHQKTHDPDYKPPEFQCETCSKSFCTNYLLLCHKKSEHLGQKKSFLCSVCGKSFTTKHTLQQHVNVHTGARPYSCEICSSSFSYESALRDHKNIHYQTKKFTCSYTACNKSFLQRSALKMHEKIHREEKDFLCKECGRGFTQKQALQRHIRAHKGHKAFTCKLCSRSFGDPSIVRRHLILVHKIHKDVNSWREDVIISNKENENENNEDEESENSGDKVTQTDPASDESIHVVSVIPTQNVQSTNHIKGQPVLHITTPRELGHKLYEAVPVQVIQTSGVSEHYTAAQVTKTDNLFPKKTNIDSIREQQALEYPVVNLVQSESAKSTGDILNYEYVLPPNNPPYDDLTNSTEIDHSGYTKIASNQQTGDIRAEGSLSLADPTAVAQLIETTREIPVLPMIPEVSTVLAGPSTQDGLTLAGAEVKVRPEVLTAEKIMEIVKQLQETDLGMMDPQQMQTLYSYYNALATQYFSLAQYTLPATDGTGDQQ